jgi:hypothetical protein
MSRFIPVFSIDAARFRLLRIQTVSLADVVPDAHLVDHIDGFRPFLSRSIGIQSISQSDVWTAEVVSAETESSHMTFFFADDPLSQKKPRAIESLKTGVSSE